MRVGLTGGYATGKTFVAGEFQRLGCRLIFADQLGHRALLPSGEAYQGTVDAFGREILRSDGTIDRKKLGAIVFQSQEQLQRLTAIVHPAVFHLEEQLCRDFAQVDPDGIVMIEAAILVETGRWANFDRLILTTCDEELQIRRAMERDRVTADEARVRIRRQWPIQEKLPYAQYVVDTSGTKSATVRQVEDVHRDLQRILRDERR